MPQGQLFYLMGASGVGKDSLIDYQRRHLPADAPVRLVRRHITRPAGAGGENHIAMTPGAFQERLDAGGFAMHWRSHGYAYGIDRDIDDELAKGWQMVVNGSRHYLEAATRRYPNLFPILVSVSHDYLLERLQRRGRERNDQIEQRLQRAEALDAQVKDRAYAVLVNDGPLEIAGQQLLTLILESTMELRRPINRSS